MARRVRSATHETGGGSRQPRILADDARAVRAVGHAERSSYDLLKR